MVREIKKELKSKMPEGIWQEEPDYQHWIDEETGLDCLIVRNSGGALCGYVGIPQSHPFYSFGYSDCILPTASLPTEEEKKKHKQEQITFYTEHLKYPRDKAEKFYEVFARYFDEKRKCSEEWCQHKPESILSAHGGITYGGPGNTYIKHPENQLLWWFGFDCAHSGDYRPARNYEWSDDGEYRNLEYVMFECKELAKQLMTIWQAKLDEIGNL
jgi:hypothetical protein